MKRGERTFAALVWLLAVFTSRTVSADEPKRPLPDYDGRGPSPSPPGSAALWVPRLVLSPLYFVSEFVLRRPLALLITTAERRHWASTLINFFTFGEDHKAGLVPTAFYDFGFKPSVGLYFFADDAFGPGNDLRAHGSFGGTDWLSISGSDRVHVTKTSIVAIDAGWVRRPDYVFYGMGSRSLDYNRSRYSGDTLEVGPSVDLHPVRSVRWTAKVGAKKVDLRDRGALGDPSLLSVAARGAFAVPPGFAEGYTEGYARAALTLDSRPERPNPQSGVRLLGFVEHGTDLQSTPLRSWIKYGGVVGAFVDLNQHQRVLSVNASTEFADPLQQSGAIPFREQVVWGGNGAMRGFWFGRLVGRSGAAATLQYQWPIWIWLDGAIDLAVGNVFDAGLRDFDFNLLRLSSAIGVRSNGSPDHQFEILVGAGSETFEQGGKIDSFRLVLGGTNGF